jgi:predicted RecB family nuclease
MGMKLNAELFEAHLKCPTKCWLKAQGDPGGGNEYADWVKRHNQAYRDDAVRRLLEAVPESERATAPPAGGLKTAKWRLAVSLAVHAPLAPEAKPDQSAVAEVGSQPDQRLLESLLDAVERVPPEGRGKAAQFVPIRFVWRNKLTRDDRLVMAFDAFVLEAVLGRRIEVGRLIHGDARATLRVKIAPLSNEVRKRVEKIAALFSSATPPDLVLNRHCAECEFQARCRTIAIEKDDLSLLGGMSAKERQKLRSKGIFTVTQLSYTFRPRRRPKRLRDKREKYHHALKALAIREKKIHIVGSPELKIEGTPVYLDVEGLPDRDFYYLIGLRIGKGDDVVQHSLWADTVEDEGQIWREFLAILETVEKPVLIHYGSYEKEFFKKMGERHGSALEGSGAAKAMESASNLISAMFARIYFPTYSNGLKDVAGYLGFKWTEPDPAGVKTIIWRHGWDADGSPHWRDRLTLYNSEDCQALETLVRAMTVSGVEQEPGTPTGGLAANGVQAEAIPLKKQWGNFSSPITEFEEINRAARWDYQRDRIYARTSNRRKTLKAKTTRSKKPGRVNKVVVHPDERRCPGCGCWDIEEPKLRTTAMEDILFGRNGLRWRVVGHQYRRHICQKCGATFGSPKGFWPRSKFGRNLAAYILYHVIELAIPQLAVKRSLNRLFGYSLRQCALPRIKAMAGQIYDETRTMILQKIVQGNLAHVDETRANIRGRTGYVWVFTSLKEVAYLYSDSREGEIAQRTLADFKGVLVSDFFSAYDSLPCPQQKCLIHLIRDLNDQILDQPFDEQLKKIVMAFAVLLKTMVASVDRYGLKTHFLRKHLKQVERFYKQIERMKLQSDAAVRCRDRFEKNRTRLFTFLEHDGIPWNNNNAEHAIKAFAALRDVMEGCATEKSMESYLVLLSVCQTCKYMGVDFLDFLRSGEKDIYAFADAKRRRAQKPLEYPPTCDAVLLGLDGSYWLDLFTEKTWLEFRAAGATITGFRHRMRNSVARIRNGDILLCYLTGAMRWVGLLQVVGRSSDRRAIWTECDFPERLEVNPLIALEPEHGVPMSELAERAPFYRNAASFKKFKGFLRACPKRFRNRRDGEIILRMLCAVKRTPGSGHAFAETRRRLLASEPQPPPAVAEAEK